MEKPDPQSIPNSPGVYLYRDEGAHVIYVGKARILRRRVLSYFRSDIPAKTAAMLSHAKSLEYLTTTTDKEAFWFPLAAGTIGGLAMSVLGIFLYLPLFALRKREMRDRK